jgi:large conductance mechanosensitive channel
MLKEFRAFALRGNLLELAIAFILGLAFNAVVQALVGGVLLQLIAAVAGEPNFDALSFELNGTPIKYGLFLTALVDFVLIAVVLFFIVKAANKALHPQGAPSDPPRTRECPYCFTAIALDATRCSACTSQVEPAPR